MGFEDAAAQAGLELHAVIAHQEEVVAERGRRDVPTGAGSPCVWQGVGGLELTFADFGPHLTLNLDPPVTPS